MHPAQTKKLLKAAALLPPATARRMVAAIAAGAGDAAPKSDLEAALSEDLQPLGRALAGALQADDLPAMKAALKKISARMPDFLTSPTLQALLERDFAAALG